MKLKFNIFFLIIISIIAFSFKNDISFSNTSIRISEIVLDKNNVLCLRINIVSVDYIDTLYIKNSTNLDKDSEAYFIFSPGTKKATVEYFCRNIDEIKNDVFFVTLVNENNIKKDFQLKLYN
jgi:hypothetical protein